MTRSSHPVGLPTPTRPQLRSTAARRLAGLAGLAVVLAGSAGVAGATEPPPTEPPASEPPVSEAPVSEPPSSAVPTAGSGGRSPDTGANPPGCVEDADGGDLFTDQFTVRHAENYTLTYAATYKVLTVGEIGPGAGEQTYVLVQCGTEAPALEGDLADAAIVEIPVATMFSESTSHNGFIDVLDLESTLTGVGDESWIVTPSLRQRIDAGAVESFNTTGAIDTEAVVAADPDVYVTGGYDDPSHEALREAGIPVVANAEWLENTPPGWAEWVGVFAALTNTEARATELYDGWIADYETAAALVTEVTEQPTVLTGGLYEGTWYASGGDSVAAQFIADAGGDYLYDDNTDTGSTELDIETVLADAAEAEVWLLASPFTTEAEAEASDERNEEFDAWDDGGVWITSVPPDPTVSPIESGPVRIDDYLLDYIAILHPELVPDHELVFFSEVPES